MKVVKVGRKWVVEGDGEGWIFNKIFLEDVTSKYCSELKTIRVIFILLYRNVV